MSGDDVFSMDMPDLNEFVQSLDLLKKEVRQAVTEGIKEGAGIIREEMKRLAEPINIQLPNYIVSGDIETTKSGRLKVRTGYDYSPGYEDPGWIVVGMTYEFGRPGQSSSFRKNEYRFWSYRRLGKGKLISMKQKKGAIQPRSHIRRGHDNKVREASDALIKKVVNAEDNRMKG